MAKARPKPFPRRHPVITTIAAVLATLLLALILFLWLVNWNMLRGPIGRYASAQLHRHVELDGDLKVHLLTWTPTVSVGGIKVGQPDWAGQGQMADVGRVVISARLASLLQGRVVMPLLEIDRPILDLKRDPSGRANWDFSDGAKKAGKPFHIPPIQHFVVNDGKIAYADVQHKIFINGIVDSNERTDGAAAHAFSLKGDGRVNNQPFHVSVSGGPLLNLKLNAPYPFTADIRAGATRLTADGHLARPFTMDDLETKLTITGPDFHDLAALTGLALPNTPPYALKGSVSQKGAVFEIEADQGRFGDSDLEGHLTVKVTSDNRRDLVANLRSNRLDIKDLATLFGAPPVGKGSKAPELAAKTKATKPASAGRLLPDATLATEGLRGMDARLNYRAATVNSGFLPIQGAALDLTLDHGVLSIAPVAFSFPQGRVTATARIDARGSVPVSDIDARLSGLSLQELSPVKGPNPPIEGALQARIRLHGRGNSVHSAAAASSGAATFVVPGGHIRQAFAELLGVNAGKGLSLLLSKNQGQTGLRCAIADFTVNNGVMEARNVVFDTDVVKVTGAGNVNLGTEALNLTLKGDSKRFRMTHVLLPITIGGQLGSPALGVKPAPLVAQGAAAVVLGTFLTPLAAVLPFVDPGLAKNADCSALAAEARSSDASVKIAPAAINGSTQGK